MSKKLYIHYCNSVIKRLSPKEFQAITNKCGPAKSKFLAKIVPDFPFGCPCNIHDCMYFIGGTDEHREWADEHFRDLGRAIAWYWRPLAWIYYAGVRLGGKSSWKSRIKPASLMQVKKEVANLDSKY